MPPPISITSPEPLPESSSVLKADHRRKKSTSSTASNQSTASAVSSGTSPTSFFARFTGGPSAGSNSTQPTGSFNVLRTKSKSPPLKIVSVAPPSWFKGTFSVGVSEDANLKCRSSMEDTHTVVYDFGSASKSPAPVSAGSSGSNPFNLKSRHRDNSTSNSSLSRVPASANNGSNNSAPIAADAGYFAIFDGHAGKGAAEWCGQRLHVLLEEQLRKDPNGSVPEILDRTFTEADALLAKQPIKNAGCTAVVALLRWEDKVYPEAKPSDSLEQTSKESEISAHSQYHHYHFLHHHQRENKSKDEGASKETSEGPKLENTPVKERMLYTANAGDARIVLCRNGKAVRLSYDHKGTDPIEAQRIKNSGGVVMNGRVNGVLAVSRALGDTYIKELVTSHPYTTETYITCDDEFIILACDGLWDVATDQQAVDLIRHVKDPQEASKMLIDYALGHFSMDNLTCMVVRFDDRMANIIRTAHSQPETGTNLPSPTPETQMGQLAIQ